MYQRVHIIVTGIVQGVGYRYFAAEHARALQITGTVCNREDGAVEIQAEGRQSQLQAFLEQLRIGPRFGRVANIQAQWLPYQAEYQSFSIIH